MEGLLFYFKFCIKTQFQHGYLRYCKLMVNSYKEVVKPMPISFKT